MNQQPNDDLVWYVSYGSNLLRQRFVCYLEGGRPEGSTRTNPGARDRTPPRADALVEVPHRLVFALHSAAWGGGVAFVEHGVAGPPTKARAWLVTWEQFEDVLSQENQGLPMTLDRMTPPGWQGEVASQGWYRWVIALQDPMRDGRPAFTFTHSQPEGPQPRTAPSDNYLGTLRRGLVEMGEHPDDADSYLRRRSRLP